MGKLNMGILGGFSGAVGTVIGSSNKKGDDIIRAKSKKTRSSQTEAQVEHNNKFSLVTSFMQPLNEVLKVGFKGAAGVNMSCYNYGCKMALTDAVIGSGSDLAIDFSKIIVSDGKMSREIQTSAALIDEKVNFSWSNSVARNGISPEDKAYMVVYNVDKGELSFSQGTVLRSALQGTVELPYREVGDRMLFYLFFQSVKDATLVSPSHYLGNETIA